MKKRNDRPPCVQPHLVWRYLSLSVEAFDVLKDFQRAMESRDKRSYTLGQAIDALLLSHPAAASKR